MFSRWPALRVGFIFLFIVIACIVKAQPTLPGILGSEDKGIVLLTWNCQYDGIKEISVFHTTDSLGPYSVIGNVKKLDKGIQVFADGHPSKGKNFYKLNIVFKSGLSWGSNYCRVFVDSPIADNSGNRLPSNDSLQGLIITKNIAGQKPGKVNGTNGSGDTVERTPKISITFGSDTVDIATKAFKEDVRPPEHKIKANIQFDDPSLGPPTFIKPVYVFSAAVTGHININLPDDLKTHHYALKFFDLQNDMVLEVPKIPASKIILDRRNFQKRGIYKFVLRRDGLELETGYVTVN